MVLGVYSVLSLVGLAGSLPAQQRTIEWPDIVVLAHLKADGTLDVVEQQAMRFTGDWNGGERRFDVRASQTFTLRGMSRIDPRRETPIRMRAGSLEGVDEYRLFDDHVLRWRSRRPDAPAFDGDVLIYRLAYRYRYVLTSEGGTHFTLAHDFAFADRDEPITKLRVRLTLDSAWRASPEFAGTYEATSLPPGQGFVVRVALTRVAPDRPAAVHMGTALGMRIGLVAATVLVAAWCLVLLARHARRRAQFEPVLYAEQVTRAFLDEHIFVHPAEVIGAAWDNHVGPRAVSALIARWISEGKLASEITADPDNARGSVLHLRLLVARDRFVGYERELIDALFARGATTTSTTSIRARYKESGFNPALEIMDGVDDRVRALAIDSDEEEERLARRFQRQLTFALFVVGVVCLVRGALLEQYGGSMALTGLLVLLCWWVISWWVAVSKRDAAPGFPMTMGIVGALVGVLVASWCGVLLATPWPLGPMPVLAFTMWVAMVVWATVASARTHSSADRIRLRLRLAAARAWFDAELRRPQPMLEPGWYPYLVAFGLTKQADAWFAATAGAPANRAPTGRASSGGRASASWSAATDVNADNDAGFAGFGGGGGFSGAGGGSEFGSAIAELVDSVPAQPSRTASSGEGRGSSGGGSGSSSSSSSSSSSGGGGGGGW